MTIVAFLKGSLQNATDTTTHQFLATFARLCKQHKQSMQTSNSTCCQNSSGMRDTTANANSNNSPHHNSISHVELKPEVFTFRRATPFPWDEALAWIDRCPRPKTIRSTTTAPARGKSPATISANSCLSYCLIS